MNLFQKFNNSTTLKTRFIIYFSIFALVPILLMSLIVYNIAQKTNLEDAYANLTLNATLIKDGYAAIMDNIKGMQDYLVSDVRYGQFLTGEDDTLRDVLLTRMTQSSQVFPEVESIFITDINGRVVLDSNNNATEGNDFSDREYFRRVKQTGRITFSLGLKSANTGNPVIVVVDPVTAVNGSTVGYLAFIVDLSTISNELITDAKILDTGSAIAIETATMNVVMTAQKERLLSDYPTEIPGYKEALLDKNTHTFKYNFGGNTRISAFARDENLGWT
jgi:C4-dicarboxylate-specific signal transduction histidine kinase